jgi:SSS family solute:Na+ symporter
MAEIGLIDWFVIAVYLSGMVAVGALLARRHASFDDFFLAGRALTTPILITTLISTYYGIDVLFGSSQLAYTDGVVAWFGYARPTYGFFLIAAFVIARRLRDENFKSLPEILDRYYGDGTRNVGALASFLYSLPALSLYGFGLMGELLLGWPPMVGMAILGGIALVYTLTGGFWAVALTDSIQFLMMCVILAIAVPYGLQVVGGFGSLFEHLEPYYFDEMGDLSVLLVIVYASTGLTVLIEPTFYQRIFAARSYKNVRNALLAGIVLWGAYDWTVTIVGMIARTAALQGIIDPAVAPDASLLAMMTVALPAGVLGFFIAGVLATEMSTLDSYCLVAGGNVAYDLYKPIVKPDATDAELIRATRIGVLISWVIGFAMAASFDQMLGLWVFMASILMSTLLVPTLAGLYVPAWRRPLAGLLSSVLGLTSTMLVNAVIVLGGSYVDEEETFVLSVDAWGTSFEILQEYTMFLTVPLSLVGFVLGLALDRRRSS